MIGEVQVKYIGTDDMLADILTKQLGGPGFRKHRDNMGMKNRPMPRV